MWFLLLGLAGGLLLHSLTSSEDSKKKDGPVTPPPPGCRLPPMPTPVRPPTTTNPLVNPAWPDMTFSGPPPTPTSNAFGPALRYFVYWMVKGMRGNLSQLPNDQVRLMLASIAGSNKWNNVARVVLATVANHQGNAPIKESEIAIASNNDPRVPVAGNPYVFTFLRAYLFDYVRIPE